MIAAKFGRYDICQCLISKGAYTNKRDEYDQTPLCFAAKNGHFDIVKLLISEFNNVNAMIYHISPFLSPITRFTGLQNMDTTILSHTSLNLEHMLMLKELVKLQFAIHQNSVI